ncbi:MAG: class I SAM-dependent methyltransferase [Acidobacteriota bacterium]
MQVERETSRRIAVMPSYDAASYGDGCASFYDQLYPTVEVALRSALLELAGKGPMLELGIGTGRVALALSSRGASVHGIEASPAMIAVFRARPGAEKVPVLLGDFSTTPFGAQYQLIYSLVNTFSLLPSLDLQRACFRNIARHLLPGGRFVSEAFVACGSSPLPTETEVPIVTPTGVQQYRVSLLSSPLNILDSIASECGLYLVERWSNWLRAPYEPSMSRHISVFALQEHNPAEQGVARTRGIFALA